MPLPDEDQHQDPISPEFETGVSAGSTYNNTFTTSWEITSVNKKTVGVTTSVIVSALVFVSAATTEGYTAEYKQRVEYDNVGISSNFILYENLTNSDVVTWSRRLMDNDGVFKFLDDEIESRKENYTVVRYQDLPWNS
jgi:hypothetical protein